MKNQILFILFLILTAGPVKAIIGGSLYSNQGYQQSAIVGIQSVYGTKMDICSGIMLNSTTVLTAAHCFDKMNISTITMFRSTDMNRDRSNQMKISNSQIIIHPNYSTSNKSSTDFAIVKLNQIFNGLENVYYPPLLSSEGAEHFGLYGYGFDENNQHSILRKAFKSRNDLLSSSDQNLIVLDQRNGQGICNGDSGGPLMVAFNNLAYVVAINDSVVGPEGRDCYGKSYFRKVDSALGWIKSKM